MSKVVNVEFYGPYALASEHFDILSDSEYGDKNGIYLWTMKMQNGTYKIHYIGETKRTFYKRMKEHILNQLSGQYSIYDPECLERGEIKNLWGGFFGKNRKDKLPDYLASYLELASMNLDYIKCQSLFVAPLNADKKLQRNIEGAIANDLKRNADASAIFEEGVRYYNPERNQDGIIVKIKSQKIIEGLPEEIIL